MKTVNYENISKNYQKIKESTDKKIYAVLKSDAYGHNIEKTAMVLLKDGCKSFAVISLAEAKIIRKLSKSAEILLLGEFTPEDFSDYLKENITISLASYDKISCLLEQRPMPDFHLKVRSRMNRFGLSKEEIKEAIPIIKRHNLPLKGIYTHFSSTKEESIYASEVAYFKEIIKEIDTTDLIVHCSSTNGIYNLDFAKAIRVGIGLYQTYPTLFITGKVIGIRKVKKGESISYNNEYRLETSASVAIVNVGYADGLAKTNKGRLVYIKGKLYPIIGEVCMNVTFILADESIKEDDLVEFLGEHITLDYLSKYLKQIKHEILLNFR